MTHLYGRPQVCEGSVNIFILKTQGHSQAMMWWCSPKWVLIWEPFSVRYYTSILVILRLCSECLSISRSRCNPLKNLSVFWHAAEWQLTVCSDCELRPLLHIIRLSWWVMSTAVLIVAWIAHDRLCESFEPQIMMLMRVWPQAAVTPDLFASLNVLWRGCSLLFSVFFWIFFLHFCLLHKAW